MAGAATTVPAPVRATACGLPAALSVIWSWAVRGPAAAGVKVTLRAQFAAAARVVPQVFVCAKSEALAPEMAMLVIVRVALPGLLSVTGAALLVVWTV